MSDLPADRTILVTGGAGFIGSALVRRLARDGFRVVVVDALTYAGSRASLRETESLPNQVFEHVDITDAAALRDVFLRHLPHAVLHLAAESHVDRSIDGPEAFIQTNVVGTFRLLEESRRHLATLDGDERASFRFIHVSTDEVFGSLSDSGVFTEDSPYDPRSPYSASKAGSDHLARAWAHTFALPVIVTNCSNNFGPYQFPEKLIPLMTLNALERRPLPVYGDGRHVRDWIFVEDHVDGLVAALERGRPGETYLFGGAGERRNVDIVRAVCGILDRVAPDRAGPYERLIEFVEDRPGHDYRYAIDASRTRARLDWTPRHSFDQALETTVRWYCDHRPWCEEMREGGYAGQRLGLAVQP